MPNSNIITVTLNPAVDRLLEVRRLLPGEHQVAREISRTPGGKGVNVSRALSSLGVASTAAGFVGKDNRAEFAALFEDPQVQDAFLDLPGRTRENVSILARETGTVTHFRDVGLPVDHLSVARLGRRLEQRAGDGATVVFSGSLPPGLAPAALAGLASRCHKAGTRVAVDTSGDALRTAAGLPLWLFAPNVAELSELAEEPLVKPGAQVTAARRLFPDAGFVLVSRGAEGALLVREREAWSARVTEPLDVKNTVGCGDVLLGTFVACATGCLQPVPHGLQPNRGAPIGAAEPGGAELSPKAALSHAVATASAAACHELPATFDPALADRLAGSVALTELG